MLNKRKIEIQIAKPKITRKEISDAMASGDHAITRNGYFKINGKTNDVKIGIRRKDGKFKWKFEDGVKETVTDFLAGHEVSYEDVKFVMPATTLSSIKYGSDYILEKLSEDQEKEYRDFVKNNVLFNIVQDIQKYSTIVLGNRYNLDMGLSLMGEKIENINDILTDRFITMWRQNMGDNDRKSLDLTMSLFNNTTEELVNTFEIAVNNNSPATFIYGNGDGERDTSEKKAVVFATVSQWITKSI